MQGLDILFQNRKFTEKTFCFCLGVIVGTLGQLLSQDGTLWSSAILHGIFFVICRSIDSGLNSEGLLTKCLLCAFSLTGIQYLFGVVFNLILEIKLWDLSDKALHLSGQICLQSFLLCLLFSFPVILLSRYLIRILFPYQNESS